jgi:hypothetical protein
MTGMSEGFARVRSRFCRVCSPGFVGDNDMAVGVPLEIADEDEDFVLSAFATDRKADEARRGRGTIFSRQFPWLH